MPKDIAFKLEIARSTAYTIIDWYKKFALIERKPCSGKTRKV